MHISLELKFLCLPTNDWTNTTWHGTISPMWSVVTAICKLNRKLLRIIKIKWMIALGTTGHLFHLGARYT